MITDFPAPVISEQDAMLRSITQACSNTDQITSCTVVDRFGTIQVSGES
jgi:hypothetical protein